MRILNKGTGIAVEIDRLLRIKQHLLARIHLQNEILQSPQTNHMIKLILLGLIHIIQLPGLLRRCLRLQIHILNKIVGVNYGALAAFHLPLGKLHHTV